MNIFKKATASQFEVLQEVQRETVPAQNAEADYLMGMHKLHTAKQSNFHDKQALLAAYRHFALAVRKNSQDVRFINAMAHLLLLINNHSRAAQYINQALALEPTNPEALGLQADLQKLQSASPQMLRQARWQALEARLTPDSNEGYDRLYDDLEAFVSQEVQTMMQTGVSPEMSLDMDQVDAQEEVYEQLQDLLALLEDKIQILNEDLETQSIEAVLVPLYQLRARYRQSLENHAKFQILMDGINYAYEQAYNLRSEQHTVAAQSTESDHRIEALLDLCDTLADELDLFSESANISRLEEAYNVLLQEVQKLQDQLDD